MKNENYYGIGNDEYFLYKTLDNGKTWKILTSGNTNFKEVYERIIYGSLENGGLSYSDDGGASRINSNVIDGNWDGIEYKKELVFAHSLDGRGIWYSSDRGENWEAIAESTKSKVEIKVIDEKIYFENSDGVSEINLETLESKTVPGVVVNSDGSFSIKPLTSNEADIDYSGEKQDPETETETETETSFDADLLIVLNKIFLPQLLTQLTGKPDSIKDFSEGVTLSDLYYKKFYVSQDLYFSKKMQDSYIDWENDVGMKPLSYTLSDFLGTQYIPDDILLKENSNLDMTEKLRNTLDLIDSVLEIKKDYANRTISSVIMEASVPSNNVIQAAAPEELGDAINAQKLFYEVQKGAKISVNATIINSLFKFNVNKKISLLKAAIFETLLKIAPVVNYQLKVIKAIGVQDVKPSDFNIKMNFAVGLETAIQKYLTSAMENIRFAKISGGNADKILINIAAEKYRYNRAGWLNEVYFWLSENYSSCVIKDMKFSEEGIESALSLSFSKLKSGLSNFLSSMTINKNWFTEQDYGGELQDLDAESITRVYSYYQEIFDKFKSRCIDLLDLEFSQLKGNNFDISTIMFFLEKANSQRDGEWEKTLKRKINASLLSIVENWNKEKDNI